MMYTRQRLNHHQFDECCCEAEMAKESKKPSLAHDTVLQCLNELKLTPTLLCRKASKPGLEVVGNIKLKLTAFMEKFIALTCSVVSVVMAVVAVTPVSAEEAAVPVAMAKGTKVIESRVVFVVEDEVVVWGMYAEEHPDGKIFIQVRAPWQALCCKNVGCRQMCGMFFLLSTSTPLVTLDTTPVGAPSRPRLWPHMCITCSWSASRVLVS